MSTAPFIKQPATDPTKYAMLVWDATTGYRPVEPGDDGDVLVMGDPTTAGPGWVSQAALVVAEAAVAEPQGSAGGYLSGTYPNPNVAKVLGSDGTSSATAGDVGQYIESVIASASAVGNAFGDGEFGNITSISLTAGDWDVYGVVGILAGTYTATNAAISVNTGNTTTDHVIGSNELATEITAAHSVSIPAYRLLLTGTTTVYLKAKCTGTEADIYYGRISARRRR